MDKCVATFQDRKPFPPTHDGPSDVPKHKFQQFATCKVSLKKLFDSMLQFQDSLRFNADNSSLTIESQSNKRKMMWGSFFLVNRETKAPQLTCNLRQACINGFTIAPQYNEIVNITTASDFIFWMNLHRPALVTDNLMLAETCTCYCLIHHTLAQVKSPGPSHRQHTQVWCNPALWPDRMDVVRTAASFSRLDCRQCENLS